MASPGPFRLPRGPGSMPVRLPRSVARISRHHRDRCASLRQGPSPLPSVMDPPYAVAARSGPGPPVPPFSRLGMRAATALLLLRRGRGAPRHWGRGGTVDAAEFECRADDKRRRPAFGQHHLEYVDASVVEFSRACPACGALVGVKDVGRVAHGSLPRWLALGRR